MHRRQFIAGAAGLIAGSLAPRLAMADVPTAFTFDMAPPMDNREKFIAWGVAQRGEDPKFLGERFDRFGAMVRNEDLASAANITTFTASRIMSEWERARMVRKGRGRVLIPAPERLLLQDVG